jgi:D-glycero-beta-D-manno-heptose 1-phosphate adenylyltransferase
MQMNFTDVPEPILQKIIPFADIAKTRSGLENKSLVFTNGCFDILHPGHLSYLYKARTLGDFLWIGLNSDLSVKRLKGESRPIHSEMHRAIMLSGLGFVDAVTVFSEDNPIQLLTRVRPSIHVKGGDYKKEDLIEYGTVLSFGGRVEILPFLQGHSTTGIIQSIHQKLGS